MTDLSRIIADHKAWIKSHRRKEADDELKAQLGLASLALLSAPMPVHESPFHNPTVLELEYKNWYDGLRAEVLEKINDG